MKFFLPKTLSYLTTNVGELETETGGTYVNYSVILGYNTGTTLKYGTSIFEALTTIYPLAHYVWEDAIVTSKYAVNLHTQTDQYPVSGQVLVPIVDGVTVVYVRSMGKYFIAKATATIDFMLESNITPAHFNEIVTSPVPYRNTYNYPVDATDTLYWGYNGVANKYRALDRAIGTQTVKHGLDTPLTMSFSASGVSALSLFYVDAETVTVRVYDNINPALPLLLFTETRNMIDVSLLNTYEKVCTIAPTYASSSTFMFSSRYSQRIDITVTKAIDPKIGAVKAGFLEYLGETLDSVELTPKSYNETGQRVNGEMVWNPLNKEANKVYTLRYNIILETTAFDVAMRLMTTITDKEVVLLGDDGDPAGYSTLLNYGAITSAPAVLRSNNTKSTASIEIENFT